MSLELDDRRRGILAEMGVRLFEPHQTPESFGADAVQPVGPVKSASELASARATVAAGPAALPRGGAADRPAVDGLQWDALAGAVMNCRACQLCEGRAQTIFGAGDAQPDWLIVEGAPGEREELQGEPFAGPAGRLLDNMLKSIGLDRRNKVYLANSLKCRPSGNRNPEPGEIAQCEPFLRRQVELLRPRIIVAMGRFAVQSLLATNEPLGKLRGRAHQYQGVPVVVTYHPADLLRNLPEKAKAWSDLCFALELMRGHRA